MWEKMWIDKWVLISITALFVGAPLAIAGGPGSSGGGDPCEGRFSGIAEDLKGWLGRNEGPKALSLPDGIDAPEYVEKMLDRISVSKIKCVSPGDEGHPVTVGTTHKVCKFDNSETGTVITCDRSEFLALSSDIQYSLVHHEYAGASGLENPNEDQSNYLISNQILEFLEARTVLRLGEMRTGKKADARQLVFEVLQERFDKASMPKMDCGALEQCAQKKWSCSSYVPGFDPGRPLLVENNRSQVSRIGTDLRLDPVVDRDGNLQSGNISLIFIPVLKLDALLASGLDSFEKMVYLARVESDGNLIIVVGTENDEVGTGIRLPNGYYLQNYMSCFVDSK